MYVDILIVGGGTGGTAAAMAAASMGLSVMLTEETDWIGGQLTSQAVPPDEHPWIEVFGCTKRYRDFRNAVRAHYGGTLNPGAGWVSRICCEPKIGETVLRQMLPPQVDLRLNTVATKAHKLDQRITAVEFRDTEGNEFTVEAKYILDATETGDLLPLTQTAYVIGSESRAQTGEPSAPETAAHANIQAITWCFAMAHDPGSHRTIDRPESYDRWSAFQPPFWPGPLIGELDLKPSDLSIRNLPTVGEWSWFTYRQIVAPSLGNHAVTIVNWPMNDYFLAPMIDNPNADIQDAKQLGLCLLYWLQTARGLPGMYLRPDITETTDGFAKTPYHRESRRIISQKTITENYVVAHLNPGAMKTKPIEDSVGIGCYRLDLHPTTGGDNYLDLTSLPFQIPLSALIPTETENLIPACKNIGTTHITNGCYRLQPVEWNIGESAGLLAAYCIIKNQKPLEILDNIEDFQSLLTAQGIELEWPNSVTPV